MAEQEFGMHPENFVKMIPMTVKHEFRRQTRQLIEEMKINEHEFTVMMIIPYIGSVQDEYHRQMVDEKVSLWHTPRILRDEVYYHYINEKVKTIVDALQTARG